ncbi:hypothetical protein ASE75_07720 [Sphingomonas sp. Leaf17]|uniref:hypothetical protein n=1 Tax=Sphingomonas sp. Leaf17 TaxID=1735683 RepID=UPI0006F9D9D8|nr:hypothetical protein [Sphingomonas sp. Leaf17]KQM64946.1 hypothetical protein ASE75_07720 [Sphingomonas sp. Leaf17]
MLARALAGSAIAAGCSVRVIDHRSIAWSSATFVGERHRLTLVTSGDAADWLAGLPDAEFALRGHLVVDLLVVGIDADAVATVEVLTLIES